MKIYYFTEDIMDSAKGHLIFGTGKEDLYTSKEDLIRSTENFIKRRLRRSEIRMIKEETLPNFDYYAIQGWCDGFGNDTFTVTCFRTYAEAKNYIEKNRYNNYEIVGQYWGKDYRNYWE